VANGGGGAARVSQRGGEEGTDRGVHLIEGEVRECNQLGRREPKRKTHFYGDTIDTWARWAGEEGRPARLAGPKAMWAGKASRAESEK
jgi:hypothetical protein